MDTHGETEFWSRLLDEIIADLPGYYGRDNWDAERFGPYRRPAYEIPLHIINALTHSSVTPPCLDAGSSVERSYKIIYPYLDDFAATWYCQTCCGCSFPITNWQEAISHGVSREKERSKTLKTVNGDCKRVCR
jgi:hypothetical protein